MLWKLFIEYNIKRSVWPGNLLVEAQSIYHGGNFASLDYHTYFDVTADSTHLLRYNNTYHNMMTRLLHIIGFNDDEGYTEKFIKHAFLDIGLMMTIKWAHCFLYYDAIIHFSIFDTISCIVCARIFNRENIIETYFMPARRFVAPWKIKAYIFDMRLYLRNYFIFGNIVKWYAVAWLNDESL